MAEKLYRQGLLGWLTGFDPNNPTAPRKPAFSQAPSTPAPAPSAATRTGTGPGMRVARAQKQSAAPAPSAATRTGTGPGMRVARAQKQSAGQGVVNVSRSATVGNPKRTRPGAAPAPAIKPVAKPTPKPMSTMAKLRADKDFMSTIEKDAAALRKPAQKAAPKAAASKKSSGLSANKSYADYKKLMESM